MAPDSAVASGAASEHEVMASVDGERLVIADITADDAWLSIPETQAAVLPEFR